MLNGVSQSTWRLPVPDRHLLVPTGSDTASQQEFTSCLKETLSGLARNATDLQVRPPRCRPSRVPLGVPPHPRGGLTLSLQSSSASEEELAKALEGLGLEEGDGEGSVLPVMRSIMQSLLSKDVLYPSLKEITEKVGGPLALGPGGVAHQSRPDPPPSPRSTLSGCGGTARRCRPSSTSGTGHSTA